MTYYEDETPYRYMSEFVDRALNIGWLDKSVPYQTGEVPGIFAEKLTELARHPINLTRGWHYCNLCHRPSQSEFPQPVTVHSSEGDFQVGHGEIRVNGKNGIRYAAPDMIIHYVLDHGYRPPAEFIDAVLSQP